VIISAGPNRDNRANWSHPIRGGQSEQYGQILTGWMRIRFWSEWPNLG